MDSHEGGTNAPRRNLPPILHVDFLNKRILDEHGKPVEPKNAEGHQWPWLHEDWPDGEPEPVDWFIEGLIARGSLGILAGEGGLGKTKLALQLAAAVAAGKRDWLPGTGTKLDGIPKNVLLLNYEEQYAKYHREMYGICMDMGGEPREVVGNRVKVAQAKELGPLWGPKADGSGHTSTLGEPKGAFDTLKALCDAKKPELLFIDTLAHASLSNENDRGIVTEFTDAVALFAETTGITTIMLSHPPKSSARFSGSTAWRNNVRLLMSVERAALVPAGKDSQGRKTEEIKWPCLMVDKNNETGGIEHAEPVWWFATDRRRGGTKPGLLDIVDRDRAVDRVHAWRDNLPPTDAYEGEREYQYDDEGVLF